jgi:hypothetical protein
MDYFVVTEKEHMEIICFWATKRCFQQKEHVALMKDE